MFQAAVIERQVIQNANKLEVDLLALLIEAKIKILTAFKEKELDNRAKEIIADNIKHNIAAALSIYLQKSHNLALTINYSPATNAFKVITTDKAMQTLKQQKSYYEESLHKTEAEIKAIDEEIRALSRSNSEDNLIQKRINRLNQKKVFIQEEITENKELLNHFNQEYKMKVISLNNKFEASLDNIVKIIDEDINGIVRELNEKGEITTSDENRKINLARGVGITLASLATLAIFSAGIVLAIGSTTAGGTILGVTLATVGPLAVIGVAAVVGIYINEDYSRKTEEDVNNILATKLNDMGKKLEIASNALVLPIQGRAL